SQPFELSLNRYRLPALPALIKQASSTSQFASTANCPFTQSMARLRRKRMDMFPLCGVQDGPADALPPNRALAPGSPPAGTVSRNSSPAEVLAVTKKSFLRLRRIGGRGVGRGRRSQT